MSSFKIEVTDGEVIAAMNRLADAARNPRPALKAIGEALLVQTRRTFETSTDPWGRRWVPNAPATIAAMLAKGKGNFRKRDGKLSSKGAARVTAKRPLIGESRFLSASSLHYAIGNNALTVGSSAIYAAIQQFGGKKSEFPHLWGDIPARPFLPVTASGELSPEARRTVVDVIQEFLLGSR
jgi:phage gpG-like protein